MTRWLLVFPLFILACGKTPVQIAPPEAGSTEGHRFSNTWGDRCIPRGPGITLRGTIRVQPFGKGTDGVRILVEPKPNEANTTWILSYRAEGVLKSLDGKAVEVRGRECDKQFEALAGKHFDLEGLQELP